MERRECHFLPLPTPCRRSRRWTFVASNPAGNEGQRPAFSRPLRYFFNVASAVHNPDNEGLKLSDLDAAREAAVRLAGVYPEPACPREEGRGIKA